MFRGRDRGSSYPNQREQRVIELVARGLKNKEVADEIGTTEHVIKNYLRTIYDKLGLWNRVPRPLQCIQREVFGLATSTCITAIKIASWPCRPFSYTGPPEPVLGAFE